MSSPAAASGAAEEAVRIMADPISIASDSVATRRADPVEPSPDLVASDVLLMTVLPAWDVVDDEPRSRER
jgi:hypothetical protein